MTVRAEVEEATRFSRDPGDYTLGELARWSATLQALAPFSLEEERLVSEQWVSAIVAINLKQGLTNVGALAYIVDQEAQLLLKRMAEE